MATQAGGAATHYGILYQVMNSADVALSIETTGDATDPDAVTLLVEPRGGGGDMVARATHGRTVYQFKARSDHGTWSLNEIIDEVLPDLFKAVPPNPDGDLSEYVFVTEGRDGDISHAKELFRELARDSIPDDPLDALDDTQLIRFYPAKEVTRRAFFRDVAARLSKAENASDRIACRRTWALLSRFRIRQQSAEDAHERVSSLLSGYVDYAEDVQRVAPALYGLLLQFGSRGERRFTLEILLRRLDLPTISLARFPSLRETTLAQLHRRLGEIRYDATVTVRRVVSWPSAETVLCLAGGSGIGKTTLLAQVAVENAASANVVFVATRQGVEDALQRASDEVWNRIVGHDRPLHWESLVRRAKTIIASETPWLTVCFDLTASVDEALALIALPWREWGVRVAFTADENAVQRIRDDAEVRERAVLQAVGEMRLSELRELLQLRGRSMAGVPQDVLELLRRPILADLYCKLSEDANWRPTNEYELYDRFWRHVTTAKGQAQHPQDVGVLVVLATAFLDNQEPYPWPADVLLGLHISSEVQLRLQRLGWLRVHVDGDVEFAHDRFLNWAVARAVLAQLERGKWSSTKVAEVVGELFVRTRQKGERYLGYVPMDVVWLLVQYRRPVTEIVEVLQALEGSPSQRLYEELLPAIGPGLLSALLARMRVSETPWYAVREVRVCMKEIATRFAVDPAFVLTLLQDSNVEVQDAGLELARLQPSGAVLDVIWRLYRERKLAVKDGEGYHRQEIAQHALVACCRVAPEWIRTATTAQTDREQLETLGWLVAILANEDGRRLWFDMKSIFLEAYANDGFRGAIDCIDRYRDSNAVDYLIQWTDSEADWVAQEAFAALCRLKPDVAIGIFERSEVERMSFYEDWWLSPLLLKIPDRTRTAIRDNFQSGQYSCAALHWAFGGEREIDEQTIDAALERLEAMIDSTLRSDRPDRPPPDLEHLIALLGSIDSRNGLRMLRQQRDRALPRKLHEVAVMFTPHGSNTLDRHFVRQVHRLLLSIGGLALEQFLRHQLDACHSWCGTEILSMVVTPSSDAIERLVAIAHADGDDDEHRTRRMAALHALAAMGERSRVLSLLFENSRLWVDDALAELLVDLPPATDDEIAPMVAALKDHEARSRVSQIIAVSGRSDLVEGLVDLALSGIPYDDKGAVLTAVRMLADESTPVATIGRLDFRREAVTVAYALRAIGTDEALDQLEQLLLTLDPLRISDDLAWIAARMVIKSGRTRLAEIVWRFAQREHRYFWRSTPAFYEAIGYLDNEEAMDVLLVDAANRRSDGRCGAIRGLIHRQPTVAFEMACAALSGTGDRTPYPELLIDIDTLRGAEVLLGHLPHERSSLIRPYICRALRRLQHEAEVTTRIEKMLFSDDAFVRAAGAQVAGWFDDFASATVAKLSIEDVDPMVRRFAQSAVWFQVHHRRVKQLLDDLTTSRGTEAWALLEVLINSGAPLLLTRRGDSLWLGRALTDQPRAMIAYAERKTAAQLKKIKERDEDALKQFNR
jgi:hypothetical protein